MATIPLTSMANATSLTGAEILYAQQGGTDVQLTAAQIQAFIGAAKALQAYFSFDSEDNEPMLVPGSPGPPGAPGSQGPAGPAGAVYIEAYEADEPMHIPGAPGPQGGIGPQGLTGGLGPAVYLEAPEADEPLTVPGTQGPPGVQGPTGGQGAIGPVYIEAYEADEPFPIPGSAGSQGAAGTPGTTGAQGPIGPVYIEAYEADEPPIVPGPVGPPGGPGAQGGVGPQGATAYLEGPDGEEGAAGPPGLPGPAGAAGTTGSQGPIGPPVYLEAPDADEPVMFPGVAGPAGATGGPGSPGVQGQIGPPGYLESPEADEPIIIPGAAGPAGQQGNPGNTGAQGPTGPAVYLEAPEADEPIIQPGPAGVQGLSGTTGAQGPIGPPVYLEAAEADEPIMVPGVLPGPQGNPGVQGAAGPQGGPASAYWDTPDCDEPVMFPGVAGPIGPAGLGLPGAFLNTIIASLTATTSASYVMGGCNTTITPQGSGRILLSISGTLANGAAAGNACAVYVAYGTGTPPVNGAAATGTDLTGAQILSLPASGDLPFCQEGVIDGLTKGQAYWIDIAFHTTGAQSAQPQNITIAAIEQGGASSGQGGISGGYFTHVQMEETGFEPMLGQGTDPLASLGSVGNFLTAATVINDTVTNTTGGVTFAAPPIAKGQVYRIRACGTFTAVSSATARNAVVLPFWGGTGLVGFAGQNVAVSLAQTTGWWAEFILIGTSATAIWMVGTMFSIIANIPWQYSSSGSTTVTAGPQTLDLRFSMSVAVATDSWTINSVTMERLQ